MLLILCTLLFSTVSSYWIPCPCTKTTPLLAGADVLAGGYDSTQLATNVERSFKSPIFQYSFTKNNCMQSNLGGPCYLIPNELHPIDADVTMAESVQGVYYYYMDYINTYSSSFSASMGFSFTPYFGASVGYHQQCYDSEEFLTTDYITQGYGYYSEYLYTMTMPPAYVLQLDPTFELSLTMLPSTIQSSEQNDMYNEFIESYGGYYLNSVFVGGSFTLNQYTNEYLSEHYSEEWQTEQMSIQFKSTIFTMETGQSANSSEFQTSADYQENSSINLYCTGGSPSTTCATNEWMLSIPNFPSYLNLTFSPIYMLVYDDQLKHDTLKNQVDYYTRTGLLPEYTE